MNKIFRINYTFNYDGRPTSSFDSAYKGLIKVLENYNQKIPLEIEFPLTTALSEEQENLIDKALIKYERYPIFNKSLEKKAA